MATYTIDSVSDLEDLTTLTGKFAGIAWADNVFNLTTDLDLTGSDPAGDGLGWLPIGSWGSGTFFDGTFNGNGFVISNMTINRPSVDEVAFIGAIDPDQGGASGDKDTIMDLGLVNVNVTGGTYVAGLIGYVLGVPAHPVTNCYVTGVVSGARIVGGLVAGSNNGHFVNCYTDVAVTVTSSGVTGRCETGGFIGTDAIGTVCTNCYSKGAVVHVGTVTSNTHIGGFIGEAAAAYAVNTFWDTETSLQATDGTGGDATGKTTAQMKQEATYTNWDFTNDWWITEDTTYPALRVFGGVVPAKATVPSPAASATDVAVGATLSWTKDVGTTVLVYLDKKTEHDPPTTKVVDDVDVGSYSPPSDLDADTTYVWRVDTKNGVGTTTGDQWEFTTAAAEPVSVGRHHKGNLLNCW